MNSMRGKGDASVVFHPQEPEGPLTFFWRSGSPRLVETEQAQLLLNL